MNTATGNAVLGWGEFDAFWRDNFPEAPPTGWGVRTSGALQWVRFYSLPNGKRYPSNKGELSEVIGRSNKLANAVIGDGNCYSAVALYPACESPSRYDDISAGPHGFRRAYRTSIPGDQGQMDVYDVYFYEGSWPPKYCDRLFGLIANDKFPSVLFVSKQNRRIFAPYDGGVDVFLPTSEEATLLRGTYRDWLSTLASGL